MMPAPDLRLATEPEPADDMLSVIIPVLHDAVDPADTYFAYKAALAGAGRVEFVYVLGRHNRRALASLTRLKQAGEPLTAVMLSRWDGEGPALRSGLHHARGQTILTLPAIRQVDPADLPAVLAALGGCDMAVARRARRAAGRFERAQASAFHWLTRKVFGHTFGDLVCRVRAGRREVFEEIAGYGMQHHFLPLLAVERGFKTCEVEVKAAGPAPGGQLNLFARMRLLLDALALYVMVKFIRKPLRFFGAVGLPLLLAGLVYTGSLGLARLVFDVPLADRPALILGVLLIVLGIQLLALGLICEIVIFASGRRIKDYTVEKIL